jgi:hypothetical protein
MQGVYLIRRGIAFGGAHNFGRAYTVGKWFGLEGLLLERRFMYEVDPSPHPQPFLRMLTCQLPILLLAGVDPRLYLFV